MTAGGRTKPELAHIHRLNESNAEKLTKGLGKILSKCIEDKIQIHEAAVSSAPLDTSDTVVSKIR